MLMMTRCSLTALLSTNRDGVGVLVALCGYACCGFIAITGGGSRTAKERHHGQQPLRRMLRFGIIQVGEDLKGHQSKHQPDRRLWLC